MFRWLTAQVLAEATDPVLASRLRVAFGLTFRGVASSGW
jgi:hypothetical protein